jgi:parallel beta-helix repeat protein
MTIPQNIQQLADKVRNEIYGRDVRESIAQSMEATAEVAEWSREVAQAIVDGTFDEAALSTAIENKLIQLEQDYAPTLTAIENEVTTARGEEDNLGARMNNISSQLAHITKQVIYVEKYERQVPETNDTERIKRAVSDLTDNSVLFMGSNYLISSTIYINNINNLTIIGDNKGGLQIDSSTHCYLLECINCDNVSVFGLTLDAIGHTEKWSDVQAIDYVVGLSFRQCNNTRVEKCNFYRMNFQAVIWTGGAKGLRIINCYAEDLGGNGFSVDRLDVNGDGYTEMDYPTHISIIGNEINGCYDSYVGMHDAKFSIISGNHFYDTSQTGYGIDIPGCSHTTIANNIVTGCHHGIKVHYRNQPIDFNVIIGNIVSGADEGGISLEETSNNTIVRGNTVTNCRDGIYMFGSNQSIIDGNILKGNTRHGLFLDDMGTGVTSNNNIIKGNSITGNGDTGIKGENFAQHNLIHDNFVFGNAIEQIDVSSYNHISDNPIKNTTQPYLISDLVPSMGMETNESGYIHTMVGGLSGGSIKPKNFGGYKVFTANATTVSVVFDNPEPDTNYRVVLGVETGELNGLRVATPKRVDGFDLVVTTAPPYDRTVNWMIFR